MDKAIERIKDIAKNEIVNAFSGEFKSIEEVCAKHNELCHDLSERLDKMKASKLFTQNETDEVREFIRGKLDEVYNAALNRTKNNIRANYDF